MRSKVEQMLRDLTKGGRTTTTLEIKERLRITYPKERFYQLDVSHACDDIYTDQDIPYLEYTDNGKHRTYFVNAPTPTKVTRTALIDIIVASNPGAKMTLRYIKKDQSQGETTGTFQHISPMGYVIITPVGGGYKQANTRTLQGGEIDGKHYIV